MAFVTPLPQIAETPQYLHESDTPFFPLYEKMRSAVSSVFAYLSSLFDRLFPISPLTGTRQFCIIPRNWQKGLGNYHFVPSRAEDGGAWDSPLQGTISELVKKMIPLTGNNTLAGESVIIDSSKIQAHALPGGFFVFQKGLIDGMAQMHSDFNDPILQGWDTEHKQSWEKDLILRDKIAAIVGHEIVHAGLEHWGKGMQLHFVIYILLAPFFLLFGQMEEFVKMFLLAKYNRNQEFESDTLGMKLLAQIGCDPRAMIWALHFLKEKNVEPSYTIPFFDMIDRLFWDHPTLDERIQSAQIELSKLQSPALAFGVRE